MVYAIVNGCVMVDCQIGPHVVIGAVFLFVSVHKCIFKSEMLLNHFPVAIGVINILVDNDKVEHMGPCTHQEII